MPAPPELLQKVDLFESLSNRDIKRLASTLKERKFVEGETIANEGQHGVGFFVIAEGAVEYSVDGKKVGTGGPGDYFGEIALIDDGARSATVTAATDGTAYGLTAWEFRPLVEEQAGIAWEMLQMMAKRLRQAEHR